MVSTKQQLPPATTHSAARLSYWTTVPIVGVLVLYVWFISAGKWTTWPKTSIYDYYGSLAKAFLQGHLYLEDQPNPELLALPDPYRIGARKEIPYIWDASLFNERYYLYWGPAPALVILPVQAILGRRTVPDLYLVFAFVCGLYLILCALILRVWGRHFTDLPPWTLTLGLVLGGLAPPLTWMLNRPEVYEAAISAGQFFLLAGLLLSYAGFSGERPAACRLALASACWGLAIGSRNSEAIPVAFLLLVSIGALVALRREARTVPSLRGPLAALILPVGFAGISLLWYNWARFGSVLEFGYRYQLTLLQSPKHYGNLFSTAYVLPNLANYFFNSFTLNGIFPFIRPQYGSEFATNASVPAIYFSEAVTGLLFSFPFMLLAVAGAIAPLLREGAGAQAMATAQEQRSLIWLRIALIGLFLLELVTLLFFFFATERYLAEVVPSLTLLSLLGFWKMYQRLSLRAHARLAFSVVSISLALLSIMSTSLLGISSSQDRFLRANPELMHQIGDFFLH